MKKVLIIGFGSIGKRHAQVFQETGAAVSIVTSQNVSEYPSFANLDLALGQMTFDIIVVANDTSLHQKTLESIEALQFKGVVITEKPIGVSPFSFKHNFKHLIVSYNLRLSPLLQTLRKELAGKRIFNAHVYCGAYLPDWRPGRNYRQVYSAQKKLGGGVLRDLSHELDYSHWLFGKLNSIAAIGGHFSNLEIDTEDSFSIIGQSSICPSVTIHMNYLDKIPTRLITVNCAGETYLVDMVNGFIKRNTEIVLSDCKTADTYKIQARNILNDNVEDLTTFEEAIDLLKLIEAAEQSSQSKRFLSL